MFGIGLLLSLSLSAVNFPVIKAGTENKDSVCLP